MVRLLFACCQESTDPEIACVRYGMAQMQNLHRPLLPQGMYPGFRGLVLVIDLLHWKQLEYVRIVKYN